ncbi:MAG: SURF1 family protein [Acidimicrobiales bacterium]
MLRGLLRPRWIGVHMGVALLVALMVNLGLWQLDRLQQKRDFNELVTVRSEKPVQELARVVPDLKAGTAEWLRVSIVGTYDPARAVRVVNRSQNGTAGYNEVVPLRTEEFGWVIVNRGFVPLSGAVPAPAPTDRVGVVGWLRASQKRGTLGSVDSTDTANRDFQRFDIPLMARQFDGDVFPMWLQMFEESPTTITSWPAPVPFPELDEGPHQSYAFQWFFFSTVAAAAWVVVVRRKWRAGTVSGPVSPA